MGKASSAKKVARAARAAGGKRRGQRRNLAFPAIIAGLVVAGVLLIAFSARERRAVAHPIPGPGGDHWHAAYNINICGTIQPPDSDFNGQDLTGIHTHADKVIHIHPFLGSAAGQNADLGRFFDTINLQVTDDSIVLPDGTTFREDGDTCDGEPGQVVVARWDSATQAAEGENPSQIFTDDFANIRFRNDLEAYTIGFLPEGDDVPVPDSTGTLSNLTDVVDAPGASTTTVPGETTTTVAGQTTTTVAGATTTTTAAP